MAINETENIQTLFQPVPRVQREVMLLEALEVQLNSIQDFVEDHTRAVNPLTLCSSSFAT